MNLHNVKIKLHTSPTHPDNFIEIDGQRIKGVQSISVKRGMDSVPSIFIEFIPGSVELEGDFDVHTLYVRHPEVKTDDQSDGQPSIPERQE